MSGAPPRDIVTKSRAVLQKHARSFSFAAPFLDAEARDNAAVVYAFCRIVDDTVDEAETLAAAKEGAQLLRESLSLARTSTPAVDDAFDGFVTGYADLERALSIPTDAANALIDGVESDLGAVRLQTLDELLLYCYQVAGVVGLMMCGILRVKDKKAWPFAIDLGIGMQLTNICRDVLEDLGRDRVYLPANKLERLDAGPSDKQALEQNVTDAFPLVQELLARAEEHYVSAFAGLRYVPVRVRLAMFVAGYVYRGIGLKLLKAGQNGMRSRVFTTKGEKFFWATRALLAWSGSLFLPKPTHRAELHQELPPLLGRANPQ